MRKILIALFLLLILVFSIAGITNESSKSGSDIEQQKASPIADNYHIAK